jgi:tetratricopeptide (TPR) repeat protein
VEEKSRAHSDRPDRGDRADRVERPVRQERPVTVRDEAALREGIRLYNEGEYNAAIKRLNSSDMNGGSTRNRLAALKYTAFSYCVTGRQAQCRQTFDRAFKLDPDFDLGQGEHGHPLWGPVFAQARQAATR